LNFADLFRLYRLRENTGKASYYFEIFTFEHFVIVPTLRPTAIKLRIFPFALSEVSPASRGMALPRNGYY
jgi:hypothetical protein